MRASCLSTLALVLFALFSVPSFAGRTEGECEVCLSVLGNLAAGLTPAEKKDLHAIEAKLGKFCDKPSNERDTKFCYFVDPIKREISQPLKNGAPPATVCDRLKKKAPEVCALRYGAAPAAVSVTRATDLAKLRVKDLKAFIAEKSIACSPCTDKGDLEAAIKGYFAAHPEL